MICLRRPRCVRISLLSVTVGKIRASQRTVQEEQSMSALSLQVRWLHALALVAVIAMVTVAFGTLMTAGAAASSVYDFTLPSIDGDPTPLSNYKGKVVLLVNVASRCGFTPQYSALESLYEKYKDQGFVILGFPADNFGGQEPGTNAEIKTFCSTKYSVTFPMFGKVSVKGDDTTPLYKYLTTTANP